MIVGMTRAHMDGLGITSADCKNVMGGSPEALARYNACMAKVAADARTGKYNVVTGDALNIGFNDELIPGVKNWQLYAGLGVLVVGYVILKKRK